MDGFREPGDVRFEVTRRGYDREQVEQYLLQIEEELGRIRQLALGADPGDGDYHESIQAELERVSGDVEAILASAREAAEGLRTRAAAEATRWREEADADARRWRAEAEAETTALRADAEAFAERLRAEAEEETTRLRTEADAYADRMRAEGEAYSQQVREAAEAAASQTRDEARTDADTWRAEAEEESTRLRTEADAYAERVRAEAKAEADENTRAAEEYAAALRRDAEVHASKHKYESQSAAEALRSSVWDEGTEILAQVAREANAIRERAEAEALASIAEGEQQSHRLVSAARQSADEQRRAARMESERLMADAQAQHDAIITAANRAAQAAQERAQALERRRSELMGQLESVQSSIKNLEQELASRKEELGSHSELPTDSSSVRVVRPPSEPVIEAEGVRVIRPDELGQEAEPVTAEMILDDVARLRSEPARDEAVLSIVPDDEDESAAADEERVEATPEAPEVTVADVEAAGGDLDSLFARLRHDVRETAPVPSAAVSRNDADALRERLLLPIQNKAVRKVKRALTEAQNVALEELRVAGSKWQPDRESLISVIDDPATELIHESFQSGYLAASELVEADVRPPSSPELEAPSAALAADLVDEIEAALQVARDEEETPRQIAAVVSRVFRRWRTEGADERLRQASVDTYHSSLDAALEKAGHDPAEIVGGARSRLVG